jgi:DNA-binding protein HU-beta
MIRCGCRKKSDSHMASRPPAKKNAKAPAPKTPAKKAASPKKAAAPETVTLKTVFEQIAEEQELPRKQVQAIMSAMVASVTNHLKQGNRIRMSGLGILEVKARDARMGRNPATGEPIQIEASKKIAFRPAKELKDSV